MEGLAGSVYKDDSKTFGDMRRVIMSVISDLNSDQRVHKVAMFLHENNCEVLLVGRAFSESLPVSERPYRTKRLRCRFRKGILQYLEFNLRLFWFLVFNKAVFYISNDLDTLLPNFMVSKFRRVPLVYDSHEYFTGVPELKGRPLKRKVWKLLERMILPKIKYAYTVNQSISNLYKKEYGIHMRVVRNLPLTTIKDFPALEKAPGFMNIQVLENVSRLGNNPGLGNDPGINNVLELKAKELLPPDRTILIMQGAGINQHRGYEEAIMAMEFLPENFLLVIIGNGVVFEQLKSLTTSKELQQKVTFIPKVPYEVLNSYTQQAFLGLSLDKPVSINNELSLPNKIFDYMKAGVPVLSSSLPEIKKILEQFCVGRCIDRVDPKIIAGNILEIYNDPETYRIWKLNTVTALKELNWETEKPVLMEIYRDLIK
jgi:glycosyltransferase involved in cell wall biosynthesis